MGFGRHDVHIARRSPLDDQLARPDRTGRVILAGRIRLFEMDVEIIVGGLMLFERVEQIARIRARIDYLHAEEPGQPFVHGVIGDGRRPQFIKLGHRGDRWKFREATEERRVRLGFFPEDFGDVAQQAVDDRRRFFRFLGQRRCRKRRLSLLLRVGVRQGVAQSLGADLEDEAMLLAGEKLDANAITPRQRAVELPADGFVRLGRDTACLLYTSDAADDLLCVDLGGRRIIKKKTTHLTRPTNHTDTTHVLPAHCNHQPP